MIKEIAFRKAFRIWFRVQALYRECKINYVCKIFSLFLIL
ncbi:hypothetical protein M066_2943 [Bacteroides fragilis str. I1345]|nr:hypothetical protein M065_3723 [Bacteroides fragilis str. Korea 419]EYB18064.1 hypothetical protein M066_2943 [Bacteroides fragilis str. I1345]